MSGSSLQATQETAAPRAGAATLVRGLISELRSPLSRIELAASQLLRELATPSARALAACISEAVREADRGIDGILPLLAPGARPARSADLDSLAARVCERLAPVLAARGARLVPAECAAGRLRGDPRLFEHAALGLVRAGSGLVGAGGRLELGLYASSGRVGVALRGSSLDAPRDAVRAFHPARFAALEPWAARHGGGLVCDGDHDAWRVELWLPADGDADAKESA